MEKKIQLFSNDNVFYLLLKSHIEALSDKIEFEKIKNFRTYNPSKTQQESLIIVDGKMTDISAIALVYSLRYEHKVLAPIWLFTEIKKQAYLDKALEVGVNRIVDKTFDPVALSHEITTYVLR